MEKKGSSHPLFYCRCLSQKVKGVPPGITGGGQKERSECEVHGQVRNALQEQALFLTLLLTSPELQGLLSVTKVHRHVNSGTGGEMRFSVDGFHVPLYFLCKWGFFRNLDGKEF